MGYYNKNSSLLRYAAPSTKCLVLGLLLLLLAIIHKAFNIIGARAPIDKFSNQSIILNFLNYLHCVFVFLLFSGLFMICISIILHCTMKTANKICIMVKKGLFAYEYGNPLHLLDGERLPTVHCKEIRQGIYEVTISATSSSIDDIQNISSNISSSLNKKGYSKYAVTSTNSDVAYNSVSFMLEDVTTHKELIINSVEELQSNDVTKLLVQNGTYIDLTTNNAILSCGKTRSGKTTGILSLILGALLHGRDAYGSMITIIDPKQAELSRLPHVVSLDENGEATAILKSIQDYANAIVTRQKILNKLSEQKGDAVHWWEADFHVSFLFIDEYVALRSILPKRTGKDNDDYSLATFDALIKRIITMGASAGCYTIISIAQASVEEGGLPSMLRSAMSTKILFKPTLEEARLLWDSNKVKDLPERVYISGDAWFSSTDGIHDKVSFVHFPIMNFPMYRELGRLLKEYYTDSPCEAM